ncbi:SPS-sensor serine protease component Ssy5p [[Candida] jaroonii]|uniref:SPS-sensor serine protease component Ssy5p n=1 Tax=[Candida] jaroonii TaxID=467808 RepID=A0ACA9Y8A8_9ASCO|nr:SPS-sensor serine protease component Ssy5p [[Candida] jaroonii]
MKKFLNRHKKDDEENASVSSANNRKSVSSVGSNSSIKEIEMFGDINQNDANLNLNPSISNQNAPSVFTKDSATINKSIFSSSKTMSTKQSSYFSKRSMDKSTKKQPEYGQRLQILDIQEELSNKSPQDTMRDKILQLSNDLSFIMNQYNNSNVNLTSAVINTFECLKKFNTFVDDLKDVNSDSDDFWSFDTYNNASLRKIMKIYLNFYDNLLQDDVYIKLKLLLVRNFNDFAKTLDSNNSKRFSVTNPTNIIKPQNFAIGCNDRKSLPNEDVLINIMNKMASSSIKIKEQNGSFIAPIVRGISKNLNILCLYFGYPNPTDYHLKLTQTLHDLYDDIHVVVVKNHIDLAAAQVQQNMNTTLNNPTPPISGIQKFKLPFRVPTDVTKPPMALSISIENASRTSGTMGGYIYPMIDTEKQPHLESYASSKFAISCGHVCLNNTDDQTEYPHVSSPSSVLISLYKKALTQQYEKLSQSNQTPMMEAKVAYGSVLNQVDKMFPLKKVKLSGKDKEHHEIRNLPVHRFGQIIWGERTLMSIENSSEKKLSDLAIIKVNKNLNCEQNFLGDDIAFNEFDPALMFDNLYVRKVIDLRRENELDTDIDEDLSDTNKLGGLPVFKYGSTTKFTQGNLNGIKLVYWLDGAIHSSEFIINSIDNNTAFAAGGDSGSWILSKLEDCNSVAENKGLGVLGMLHSYDGEFRQFGLFTPMCEILERLEQVTKIKWGVVGVAEKDDSKLPNEVDSDHYDSEIESVSSLSDESVLENPPVE